MGYSAPSEWAEIDSLSHSLLVVVFVVDSEKLSRFPSGKRVSEI
jgi:hypothetical protein